MNPFKLEDDICERAKFEALILECVFEIVHDDNRLSSYNKHS